MRRLFLLAALVALAPPALASGQVIIITGATVIRPDRTGADAVQPNSSIVIEDGRIAAVLQNVTFELPRGALVINGAGKWVVPGLVDSHVHFFQSGGLYTRPDGVDFNAVRPYADEIARVKARLDVNFGLWLASGVTGVVDIGGPMWNFDVRDRARSHAAAPRMAVAGPLLSMVDRKALDLGDPPIIKVDSVEAALALVKRELERQPEFIKVWFIHQPGDDLAKQEAIVKAAGDAAHAAGIRLAVHATELVVAKAALRAGADFLVHSVFDAPVDDEFVALALKNHAIYCPTLFVGEGYWLTFTNQWKPTPVEAARGDPTVMETLDDLATIPPDKIPERLRKRMAEPGSPPSNAIAYANLKRLHDAGVTIAMGTDAGNIGTLHGPSIHREMKMMVEAGLTPLEVLRSATLGGTMVLGLEKIRSSTAAGGVADLVVLDADPLADIGNLAKVHRVIKGGVVYDPEDLMKAAH